MNANNILQAQQFAPGTVIARQYLGYVHLGLLSDSLWGPDRTVFEFSAEAGGFRERSLTNFADGGQVVVIGYPSNLAPTEVMHRARSLTGHPYSLLGFNCEHFVRLAHGLQPESPQVRGWALLGLAMAGLGLLARR